MTHDSSSAPEHPLVFEPLFMERVWGGRRLELLYHKKLPQGVRVGESWEIVDREEAQSVVHDGPLRGLTLHELWTHRRDEIFGPGWDGAPRFPLLVKMLDAQERLSLQVHPPAGIANDLGGEPKTEMWYVAQAEAGADLFAGLEEPIGRAQFEEALHAGRATDLIHRIPVEAGDAIAIPSGRIHAIGAGCLIVEIQQNSDTTYRVFDWNRLGLDGSPRTLHIDQSLQSILFDDVRPSLQPRVEVSGILVDCPYFRVERWQLDAASRPALEDTAGRCAVFTCLEGSVECAGVTFAAGQFFLVPACLPEAAIRGRTPGTAVLRTTIPVQT
jgi:mannose-6-phosphate isomerase